jgi:hypothetical protein
MKNRPTHKVGHFLPKGREKDEGGTREKQVSDAC